MVSRQIFLTFLRVEPWKPISEVLEVLAFWAFSFFFSLLLFGSGAVFHTAVFVKLLTL